MSGENCEHCYQDLAEHHHRNLRCPGRESIYKALPEPVYWNPYNKVVQDHRDGTIYHEATNAMRERQGLPVPWTPAIGKFEVYATEDRSNHRVGLPESGMETKTIRPRTSAFLRENASRRKA